MTATGFDAPADAAADVPGAVPADVAAGRVPVTAAVLHRALAGRVCGDDRLRIAPATPARAEAWVQCTGGVALAPLAAAGAPLALLADDDRPDAPAMITALTTLAPLLTVVEAGLGVSLRPDALATTPPAGVLLEVRCAGDRLLLAVAPDAAIDPQPAPPDPTQPLAWRLALPCQGRLSRWPSAGDLVLGIAARGWLAAGDSHAAAQWSGTGISLIDPWWTGPAPPADTLQTILSGDPVPAERLLACGPGDRLPLLAAPRATLVDVQGTWRAPGRLIPIGDGLGLLVEAG